MRCICVNLIQPLNVTLNKHGVNNILVGFFLWQVRVAIGEDEGLF